MLKGSSNSAFDGVKVKYLRKGVEAFNALLPRQSSWLSICWCYTKHNLISSQARSPSTSPATSAVVLMICVCFAGSKKKTKHTKQFKGLYNVRISKQFVRNLKQRKGKQLRNWVCVLPSANGCCLLLQPAQAIFHLSRLFNFFVKHTRSEI